MYCSWKHFLAPRPETNKKAARLNCIKHILLNVNYERKTDDKIFEIDNEILITGIEEIENMEQDHKLARLA